MRWPHYKHVFFDCDSTLTAVEGIDILAESAGKRWRVEVLTQAAMDGELDLEDVYAKRLRAVKPTHQQIRDIRRAYKRHMVQDAKALIAALQDLGHQVYIISGGLLEPVREFGVFLGVPSERIRAVGVTYNELSGQWWVGGNERYLDYEEGALTVSDGKAEIVQELLGEEHGRSLLVGDGYSDLLASRAVDLFAGFGGVVQRQRVAQKAPVFVQSTSLAPLLAIAAGPAAIRRLLKTPHEALSRKALDLIQRSAISFNEKRLEEKFVAAFDATCQAIYPHSDEGALG
ncbi:MAG: HAD-IB family phosphatase [Chloroflexi bacterium]|jgi:phosphoserine phosphatase|nr:HAD-IB family phosphatase [Chloroflexota bacterium]